MPNQFGMKSFRSLEITISIFRAGTIKWWLFGKSQHKLVGHNHVFVITGTERRSTMHGNTVHFCVRQFRISKLLLLHWAIPTSSWKVYLPTNKLQFGNKMLKPWELQGKLNRQLLRHSEGVFGVHLYVCAYVMVTVFLFVHNTMTMKKCVTRNCTCTTELY